MSDDQSFDEVPEEEYLDTGPQEPGAMDEILKKTPWWAISVAFHTIVLLILWVVKIGVIPTAEQEVVIEARIEEKEEPEYDPEKERDIIKRESPLLESNVEAEVPVVVTEPVEVDDHFETDNDMETDTSQGFEDAVGFVDAGSVGVVSSIGVGGGGRGGRYGFRGGGGKKNAVGKYGGSKATESAVDAALRWLMRHQGADGGWHPDTWSQLCPAGDSCVGANGGGQNDTGGDYPASDTGFALLAFLGAGHTHTTGSFRDTVKRGVEYLLKNQKQNGKIEAGAGRRMYTHGIAALALAEAYGMTQSAKLKGAAQDAIDYIVYVQNPLGGWNYSSPAARNDTSVSGWQMMALKSAKIGGLSVPEETIKRTIRYLEIISGKDYSGKVAYAVVGNDPNNPPAAGGGSIRMRAVGMLGRYFFGMSDPMCEIQKTSGDVFLKQLPAWEVGGGGGGVDLYYWYYATLVNFQTGGKYWKGWNEAMKTALLNAQVKGKNHADGSWPPVDTYSKQWSRPGITALCALCLEVYYRYMPVYMGQ
ncbi:prenyltransferase/squalene oxidase repeat-containing protein [Planctomycetota bacterium]